MFAELLELDGHSVRTVGNGVDALAMARTFHPDTILCDLGLPGALDGYAVARAFRQEPVFSTTRLIAISGYANEDWVSSPDAEPAGHDLTQVSDVREQRVVRSQQRLGLGESRQIRRRIPVIATMGQVRGVGADPRHQVLGQQHVSHDGRRVRRATPTCGVQA